MRSTQRGVSSSADRSWRRTRSKLGVGHISESSDDDDYHSVNTFSSSRSRSKDDTAERENLSSSFQRRKKRSSVSSGHSSHVDRISDKYDQQIGELDAILNERRRSSAVSRTSSIGSSILDEMSPSQRRKDRKLQKLLAGYSPHSRSSFKSSSSNHDDILSSTMLSQSDRRVDYSQPPSSSSVKVRSQDIKRQHSVKSQSSRRSLRSVDSSLVSFDKDAKQELYQPKTCQTQIVLNIRPLTRKEELSKLCLLIIPPKPSKDRSSRRSISSQSSHSSKILESQITKRTPTLVKINTLSGSKHFEFDRIYEPSQSNKDLFHDSVLPTLNQSISQGCNATFFSWGPKRTGKSHTIFGDDDLNIKNISFSPLKAVPPRNAFGRIDGEDSNSGDSSVSSSATPIMNTKAKELKDHGIILKTLKQLFESLTHKVLSNLDPKDSPVNTRSSFVSSCSTSMHSLDSTGKKPPAYQYKVALQVLHIRGEQVYDLLPTGADKTFKPASSGDLDDMSTESHSLRTIASKLTDDGNFDNESVEMSELDIKYAKLDSYEQALWYLSHAINTITTFEKKHPRVHGHTIVTLIVTQKTRVEKHRRKHSRDTKYLLEVKRSKIRFVDIGETDLTGQAQSTSSNEQNDDLTILRNVVYALSLREDKNIDESLIPYGQSKLTSVLKGSLGGNHKTVFITCVSQSSLHQTETMKYLKLSRRAKMIKNKVAPNVRTLSRSKTSKVLLKSTKRELEDTMTSLDEKLAAMAKELQDLKAVTEKASISVSSKSVASHDSQKNKEKGKEAATKLSENTQSTIKESPPKEKITSVESRTPKFSNRMGDSNKEEFHENKNMIAPLDNSVSEKNSLGSEAAQKCTEAVPPKSIDRVENEDYTSAAVIGAAVTTAAVAESLESQKKSKAQSEIVKGIESEKNSTDSNRDIVSAAEVIAGIGVGSIDTATTTTSPNIISTQTSDLAYKTKGKLVEANAQETRGKEIEPKQSSDNASNAEIGAKLSDGLTEGMFVSSAAVIGAAATTAALVGSFEAQKESNRAKKTKDKAEIKEKQADLKHDEVVTTETVADVGIATLGAVVAMSSSNNASMPQPDLPKASNAITEEANVQGTKLRQIVPDSSKDVVTTPKSNRQVFNDITDEFVTIDLSNEIVKENGSKSKISRAKYDEFSSGDTQSKGERSEQTASQPTNGDAGKGFVDGSSVSYSGLSAGNIRTGFSGQNDFKTPPPYKPKIKKRNSYSLFTPRSYATMPSISEREGFDSDDTTDSPHRKVIDPKLKELPSKYDSVNISDDLLAISDVSEDDSLPRRQIITQMSDDDDDFLAGVNRGHVPIKASEDVKTILKVDSSSFKFNSELAQSFLLTENMNENGDDVTNKKHINKQQLPNDARKITTEEKTQIIVENIPEAEKMKKLDNKLEKEPSICSEFSLSTTHSSPNRKKRSLFCSARKSRGRDSRSHQSACLMDWVNRIFPEKSVSTRTRTPSMAFGRFPSFQGFPTAEGMFSLRKF